jgi:hypothetical protein
MLSDSVAATYGEIAVVISDESLKFIKDSVARNTWWALGTRANGEVVDASSY